MRFTTDTALGAWLTERIPRLDATPETLAGSEFEAYARVLPPVGADRFDRERTEWGSPLVVEEGTFTWAEVARRNGRVMHPLVQWSRLTDDESLTEFDDGWRLDQAPEGFLPPELLAALTVPLAAATTTPDEVVAGVWDGWGELHASGSVFVATSGDVDPVEAEAARAKAQAEHETAARAAVAPEVRDALERTAWQPTPIWRRRKEPERLLFELPAREYLLFETTLAELADPTWPTRAGIGWHASGGRRDGPMPALIWPADHAWCVATEVDATDTIVGGSRALIDAIVTDPAFEAYEVAAADQLYPSSDTLNA